ncbi:MAG: hypothetical protein MJ239_02720 [Bacilli bacterium]|nr:hypothetical protein [Bacilli bacterium]
MKSMRNDQVQSIINKMVRASLLEIGYGTSAHIYDIRPCDLAKTSPETEIIKNAIRLYESLGTLDRMILRAEIFEKGRYYMYWYLPYANSKAYSKKKKKVIDLAVRTFL